MMSIMHVLGLRLPTRGGKRVVLGTVIDTTTRQVAEHIEHVPDSAHDEASQARELRDALRSSLSPYKDLEAVVLYEADYSPRSRVTKGTKDRLRFEGAALTACRDHAQIVKIMDGPAVGRACGGAKRDALDAARSLGVTEEYVEATAAALAADSLAHPGPAQKPG